MSTAGERDTGSAAVALHGARVHHAAEGAAPSPEASARRPYNTRAPHGGGRCERVADCGTASGASSALPCPARRMPVRWRKSTGRPRCGGCGEPEPDRKLNLFGSRALRPHMSAVRRPRGPKLQTPAPKNCLRQARAGFAQVWPCWHRPRSAAAGPVQAIDATPVREALADSHAAEAAVHDLKAVTA